jgi:hypothetical protein
VCGAFCLEVRGKSFDIDHGAGRLRATTCYF